MALGRLAGTRLIERLRRVSVPRAGAVVFVYGIVGFVTAPALPLTMAGVAAGGPGTALDVPVLISAVADTPRPADGSVSGSAVRPAVASNRAA